MRVGLMIEGQEDVTWEEWRALARACEEHGVESLFRSDHYLSVEGRVERVMLQHLLHRDLDAVEQIGRRVVPTVRGGAAAWPAAGRPARRPR